MPLTMDWNIVKTIFSYQLHNAVAFGKPLSELLVTLEIMSKEEHDSTKETLKINCLTQNSTIGSIDELYSGYNFQVLNAVVSAVGGNVAGCIKNGTQLLQTVCVPADMSSKSADS